MVFPTLQFVLFFAIVLTLNVLVSRRAGARKALLIAVSYVFYAAWDWRFCLLMLGVSCVAWIAGLFVKDARWGQVTKVGAIVLMLGVLGVFKYFNFFLLSFQQLLGDTMFARDLGWMRVVLPVGISFYTFQAISYVMDVARGDLDARKNPADVALYISFFPQLVAGPIVRAADFLPQIDRPFVVDAGARGAAIVLILTGLFKKLVVANYLSVLIVDPVFTFPEGQDQMTTALAVLGYGVQIYCDFSGYSDIAIGIALLLGYRFQRNFNQPYRARGLSDFWRRWHISLSTWIRDYLYIPMGGNTGGAMRSSVVVMATMTLAGLWHGSGWNFLAWGALHGGGLIVERALGRREWSVLAVPVTLVFVLALWIPFRAANWEGTMAIVEALMRPEGTAAVSVGVPVFALLGIGLAMNWLPLTWRDIVEAFVARQCAAAQAAVLAVGTVLCFAAAQDGVAPFIYFQF